MNRPTPPLPRWLAAVVVLLLGLACGVATALVHRDWWGMALGIGAAAAVTVALPGTWWGRPAFAAGWVLAMLAALLPPGGGGFLVVADLLGYGLLGASLLLLLVSVATSRPGRARSGVGPSS